MEEGHVLRSGVFEISSDTTDNSHEIHNSLNDIIQSDLNRILGEVFDEVCPMDYRIKINSLDLDLGDINQHNFESEFKFRLKDALRMHIRRLIDDHKFLDNVTIDQNYKESLIPDVLESYLNNGVLPWFSSPLLSSNDSFIKVVHEFIKNDINSIRKVINRKASNEAAIYRLYKIFPDYKEWMEFSFAISNNPKIETHKKTWIEFVEALQKSLPFSNRELLNRLSGYVIIFSKSSTSSKVALKDSIQQLLVKIQKERPDLFPSFDAIINYLTNVKSGELKRFTENNEQIVNILEELTKKDLMKNELKIAGNFYSFDKLQEISKSISAKKEFIRKISLIELKKFIDQLESSLSSEIGSLFNIISEINIPHLEQEKLVFYLKESVLNSIFTLVEGKSKIRIQKIIVDFLELLAKSDIPLRKYILSEIIEKAETKKGSKILSVEVTEIKNELTRNETTTDGGRDLHSVLKKFFLKGVLNESDKIGNLPSVSNKVDIEKLIIHLFGEYIMDLAEVFRSFNKRETIIAFQRIEVYLGDEYKKEILLRMAKTLPPKVVFIARSLLSVPEESISEKQKELFIDKLISHPDVIKIMLETWAREGKKPSILALKFNEFIELFTKNHPEKATDYFNKISVSDYNFIVNQLSEREWKAIVTELNLPEEKFFNKVSEKFTETDSEPEDKSEISLSDEALQTDPIFIKNAGLVLLSPYLSRFFDITGLLKNKKEFKSDFEREKACHFMHFLATGLDDGQEYMMVLNKLIAGIPLTYPLKENIILTDEEKQTAEGLLNGVIKNWTALKKSSPENLRGSFLLREGKLIENDKFWDLRVEEKGFDILIDKIPWAFKVIRLPWMKKPVHVTWR
ncbi:contractile injection system tape measure protein [Mangrovivirga sp. M17]|uniref:Contractile injection system tape measure protein n=1 Tax=Mangrovivirga halotolerans TaxID=2993936 RepID=A0ABT3RMU2_9BACT|nr:contractile injection system tape measure protein [Mangrovivirga halotolerans]MCX2742689.1 contractile injection system tape measure protein [Mangrovivirga halotolerans]